MASTSTLKSFSKTTPINLSLPLPSQHKATKKLIPFPLTSKLCTCYYWDLQTISKLYRFSPSLGMAAMAKPRLMKEEIGEEAGVFNQTKNLIKPLKKSIWLLWIRKLTQNSFKSRWNLITDIKILQRKQSIWDFLPR